MININKQINFYNKNGYLIVENVLSKKQIEICSKRLEYIAKKQAKETNPGLKEPGIKKSLIHAPVSRSMQGLNYS